MWEAKCLKKSAIYCWKSTEIRQKLQFFFICLSLKPHKIQMKKDNSKIQKQASLLVFCVIFLFSNHPSKSTGSPFTEADPKGVKVVNFVAKRLNLYPHTVSFHNDYEWFHKNTLDDRSRRFCLLVSRQEYLQDFLTLF